MPSASAATTEENSQVSRSTTSGRQARIVSSMPGSAEWACSPAKTSVSMMPSASRGSACPQPLPQRLEHLGAGVGERRVRQPRAVDVVGEAARRGDEHVVARAPAGLGERDQRAEVARVTGRGEEDAHPLRD